MKQSLKLIAAALVLAAGGLASAHAAPLSVSSERTVLVVKENVFPSGAVSVTSRVGPLLTTQAGFGVDGQFDAEVGPGRLQAKLPAIPFSASYATMTGHPTRGAVLTRANATVRANFPALKDGLSTYMREKGIASAWFTFKQEVQVDVNGQAETWVITWDYFTDQNGRGGYADVRLDPPEPKTLYMVYTPLRVDADLPSSWSYNGAGQLRYQLRNAKFEPLTDWVTVDTGGLYDSPQTETENLDAGVRCLMDSDLAGCTHGPTDVKQLLDTTGAVLAVVDYVRRVEPKWIEQPDGSVVPAMSTSIDTRDVTYSGCNDSQFRNTGTYGYTLQTNVGRYLGVSSGEPREVTFAQMNEFRGEYLSPTQAYDYTVPVRRGDVSALSSYAIDPIKGGSLLALTDIPGLVSIAPINKLNTPMTVLGETTGGLWWYGKKEDRYKVRWTLKCVADSDGYEITTRLDHQRYDYAWDHNAERTSAVSTTGWSSIALADFNDSRYIAYADTANRIVHIAEGTKNTSYPYRWTVDEGDDWQFVCGHNDFSMQQTGTDNYECTNNNLFTYDCGAAANSPTDVYENGVFVHSITRKQCLGSTYLKGFHMDSGAPIWENRATSEIDDTLGAVWHCDDAGVCGWRIDNTSEPNPGCARNSGLCVEDGPSQLEP